MTAFVRMDCRGDGQEKIFQTLEEAISHGQMLWDHLTSREKLRQTEFAVIDNVPLDDDGHIDWENADSTDEVKTWL